MALSRVLFLLLVAMTAIIGTSEGQGTFYATKCYPPPTPSSRNDGSAFRQNLLDLLGALPSAAAPTGFASLQSAVISDRAVVRGLCFGESAPEPCRRCLSDAGKIITVQCGDASRRADFWNVGCFLGYAYADGGANTTSASAGAGAVVYFSGDADWSPDVAGVRKLVALAQSLAPRAANGSVATADTTTTPASNRPVRVLAQCERGRAAAECAGCLREASLSIANSWGSSSVVGRVAAFLDSNCYLRFETSPPSPPVTPKLSLVDKIVWMMNGHICASLCVVMLIALVVFMLIVLACGRFCT